MSSQSKARTKKTTHTAKIERPTAQQVLLAGIGAVSLIRKNAGKTLAEAGAIAGRLPETAGSLVQGAGERATTTLKEIGARGNAFRWEFERLAKTFGQGAVTAGTQAVADAQARIEPLLKKIEGMPIVFGIAITKPRSAAKSARKTARKPTKRSVRKIRKAA